MINICKCVCVGACLCTCAQSLWCYFPLLQETSHRWLSLKQKWWEKETVVRLSHFFLNTVFSATWIILKSLQECHVSKGSSTEASLSNQWGRTTQQQRALTLHRDRWHLLYVIEKEMQLWWDVVQWHSEAAVDQQWSGRSVWIHRPRVKVIDGSLRLQSSSYLLVTETQSSVSLHGILAAETQSCHNSRSSNITIDCSNLVWFRSPLSLSTSSW